jgi:hypothetical protein
MGLVIRSCTKQPPWSFGFASQTGGTSEDEQAHPVLKYKVPHGSHIIGAAEINNNKNRSCSNDHDDSDKQQGRPPWPFWRIPD